MNSENNTNTGMVEKKDSILFKELDLAFVYIFIFLVGVGIVFFVTNYLNSKVEQFSQESFAYQNK